MYMDPHTQMNVIAVETVKTDGIGNFSWMVKQEKYRNAFFIYLDVDEELWCNNSDFGYNPLRIWNGNRSFSIGVCSKSDGCYFCLNVFTKQIINNGFERIHKALCDNPLVDTIFFNVANFNGFGVTPIDTSEHPFVGNSIIDYIMKKLLCLSGKNGIKFLTKRNRYTI